MSPDSAFAIDAKREGELLHELMTKSSVAKPMGLLQ
jgi:hypothetical protein